MKIFFGIIATLLSFAIINGDDIGGHEFEILEDEQNFEKFAAEGDIDKIWGAINNDSVRVGIRFGYSLNSGVGTVAAWNVTYLAPRIMDGIRLRSYNNTGAVGELIDGGIGYNFAKFQLVGHENHFYFTVDAFENYTSSLLPDPTTPAPVPDKVIEEWGVVNYASQVILPYHHYVQWNNPGVISKSNITINSTKLINGIRLISINDTVSTGEILEGGIGFDFVRLLVVANENFLDYSITLYENGTYLETRQEVYGNIDKEVELLHENRLQNYPQSGANASGNASFSTSGIISGIRLTFLNYTDGRYEIVEGGLNESSVTYNFNGPYQGEPYDFKIEIFGNNSASIKFSMILLSIFNILVILFK